MTYFHINLDPRGQKKNVLPPILIPVGTVWLFLFVCFTFNFFFRLSKMRLQGGAWGVGPRGGHLWGCGSGCVGQLSRLLLGGGLPSSSACTVILGVQC